MKFIKQNWQKLVSTFIMLIVPMVSFAQGTGLGNQTTGLGNTSSSSSSGMIVNPIPSVTSVPGLIQTILTGVLQLGIPIVALAIIYCGFLFVFARGNEKKLTEAKSSLMWTLIGAAILLGAWALATMISNTVTAL